MDAPYFSQWESPELVEAIIGGSVAAADDPRWREWGAETVDEYAFWSWRTCGVACLRMVLAHRLAVRPRAKTLKDDLLAAGGYVVEGAGVRGLVYAPFVDYVAARWGLAAAVETGMGLDRVAEHARAGAVTMLSVHPAIRSGPPHTAERGGHLVLVVGAWRDGLVLHNPSGFAGRSQRAVRLSNAEIEPFSAGRGVVFAPAIERHTRAFRS